MLQILIALAAGPGQFQADTSYLYRTLLLRAAPGELLAVIDLYQQHRPTYAASGDGAPFIARHRQGDHWDLMLIFPMGSFAAYYAPDRITRRAQAEQAFEARVARRVSWREEVFVMGPPVDVIRERLAGGALYHIEMFVALPGKRDELFREREMENAYLAALVRPQNLIFTRVAGAAWDLFTLGVYRDMTHFAASDQIPAERKNDAALAVGFEAADRIGTYLRTLILRHHDTLAAPIR